MTFLFDADEILRKCYWFGGWPFFPLVLADPSDYVWYQSLFHAPVSYLPMQLFLITKACMWIDEWVTLLLTISWDSASFIALFKKSTLPMQFIFKFGSILIILWWCIFYYECIMHAWVIMEVRFNLTFHWNPLLQWFLSYTKPPALLLVAILSSCWIACMCCKTVEVGCKSNHFLRGKKRKKIKASCVEFSSASPWCNINLYLSLESNLSLLECIGMQVSSKNHRCGFAKVASVPTPAHSRLVCTTRKEIDFCFVFLQLCFG